MVVVGLDGGSWEEMSARGERLDGCGKLGLKWEAR